MSSDSIQCGQYVIKGELESRESNNPVEGVRSLIMGLTAKLLKCWSLSV